MTTDQKWNYVTIFLKVLIVITTILSHQRGALAKKIMFVCRGTKPLSACIFQKVLFHTIPYKFHNYSFHEVQSKTFGTFLVCQQRAAQ